jgi:glycosidase
VSRAARVRFAFDDALFSVHGNANLVTFYAARLFAQQMNDQYDLAAHPERAAKAGQLNAMELIDEILRYVVAQFVRQQNPQALQQALAAVERAVGREAVDATLLAFAERYPAQAVFHGEQSAQAYLDGVSAEIPHRQLVLDELLMLWVANMNPAYGPYADLFDDAPLKTDPAYLQIIAALHDFFDGQPTFGPDAEQLIDLLRSPAIAVPHSLTGQLEYLLSRWGFLLEGYLYRLLGSLDLIKEEEKAIFLGPGPSIVYDFLGLGGEPERFSQDRDWMPRLVLMAKNAYVWIDQLSRRYGRAITRLDQIPDEELATLARRGFSGLWLIGLWERSVASQRIKQYCGNSDAVASAYSLLDYRPADDLGGEAALQDLKDRAWRYGIRLASDMVPNHMGIDSNWVIEHPDWFVSLDYSPFPSYTFNGGDLSNDPRVGLFIEDHYYSREDAAVVFKRVDRWTGDTRYIYHGNDGTSMPWNDTAQLNYLLPQVREAVIQTILHVARQFPVIRFDAAMTLAKKHYQRLWFPEPGTGGAIPSRAEHGMTRPQFNEVFPEEFWREVVDRVAQEVPDTLLLAEAFWLMEGYFVRTLGMHRVYNSAFMNMMRDEDNAKYRSVIKNTLEFDPDIMKRYVNFMNNPDERTAIDQFGEGDKYFGICMMMSTLPGLPMFGHGQIEGFAEKYGMEFRRAYWDEQPKGHLVERHEREIAPLLHRRHIFAEAANFRLYDFFTPEGHVNEDVFAYSNRAGDERGLVIYHNKYADARGWIRTSVASLEKSAEGERHLRQWNLGEGLGLHAEDGLYTIFRDAVTGLEYLRPSGQIFTQGIYVELHAYQYHVFLDFREVHENEWGHYGQLLAELAGRGVPSIEAARLALTLRPLHTPFRALVNGETFRALWEARATAETLAPLLDDVDARSVTLLRAAKAFTAGGGEEVAIAAAMREALTQVLATLDDDATPATRGSWLAWAFTHALGEITGAPDSPAESRRLFDAWQLDRLVADALCATEVAESDIEHALLVIRVLISEQQWDTVAATGAHPAARLLTRWLQDGEVKRLLGVNSHEGVVWFNEQGFTEFLSWMEELADRSLAHETDAKARAQRRASCQTALAELRKAAAASGFQVETLLALVNTPARHKGTKARE